MAKSINGHDYPLLSEAVAAGLFHPNCRHSFGLWMEGVSTLPAPLDPEKIRNQVKLETKQRELERKVRAAKRMKNGSFTPESKKRAAKELKNANSELRDFLSEHPDELRRESYRTKIYEEG